MLSTRPSNQTSTLSRCDISRLLLLLLTGLTLLLVGSPAVAMDRGIEQQVEAHGSQLVVRAEGSSVKVLPGSGRMASVRITRRDDSAADIEKDYRIDISSKAGDVHIEVERKKKGWTGWSWRDSGLKIEVEAPTSFGADIATSGGSVAIEELDGEVLTRTSGGSVRISRVGGPAVITTSGGSVVIDQADGGVDATTSGGSIRIERSGGPVVAKTSGGSIEVNEVAGAINASTSGGSVRATITEQPAADCRLSTSGGTVSVELADSVSVSIDAKSSGGSVRSAHRGLDVHTMSKGRLTAELNGGGPLLHLRSSGGGVKISSME